MLVVLVLSLIRSVQIFDQVYVLTGGGPGSATLYLVQYIYNKGFSDQIHIFGLAAAASVIMAAVLMVFTLLQLYLSRKSDAV
jgi:alpha-1,4-digalacturonate transport system permease protein